MAESPDHEKTKGDECPRCLFLERISQLTLDSVREHELTEASPAEKAADIGAGEQQVALTSNSREHKS